MISKSIDILENITCFTMKNNATGLYEYNFNDEEIQTLDKLLDFLKMWEDIHNNLIKLKEMRKDDK